jgi:hypothetical protein
VTVELSDTKVLKRLLAFYEDDLNSLARSQVTGGETSLPADLADQAQLLNLCLYKPEIVYLWGSTLAYSQLSIYRPYIKRTGRRTAIICTGLKGKSQEEVNLKKTPAFVDSKNFELKLFLSHIPGVKTVLYITEKISNLSYIKSNPDLVHVFANHGDSDKHSNANRLGTAYDYMMVADANAISRFVSAGIQMPIEKFLIVGGSPIEKVVSVDEGKTNFINILYAPTWEGHGDAVNFSSMFNVAQKMKDFLQVEGNVRFQPHPGLGQRSDDLKSLKEDLKLATADNPAKSKADNFNWSDAIVTDISGVLSEYLFTKKPLIVPVGNKDDWKSVFFKKTGLGEYVYAWRYNEVSLADMLSSIASDPLREARISRRNKLYHGANSVKDLANLFENALEICNLSQEQKSLRVQRQVLDTDFSGTPDDAELADIVEQIRAGTLIVMPKPGLKLSSQIKATHSKITNRP